MLLRQLFDEETYTYTYLIADPKRGEALLIDTVRGKVERDLQLLQELGLKLVYVLDTHVHADHVTGAGLLRERVGAKVVASPKGAECADVKVKDGDVITMGDVQVKVLETPGHTDDSLSYVIGDNVFTGDALLVRGCGRTDFQNGDTDTLYDSITGKLFALSTQTVVWPGHDYRGQTQSTIAEEKQHNPRLANKSREEFQQIMGALNLPRPKYLDVAVPANRECGMGAAPGEVDADVRFQELPVAAALAFAAERGATIMDVREPHEFVGQLGHIEGAVNIPHSTVLEASLDMSLDQPIVVVCRSGRRSRSVCESLARRGFRELVNLDGGMVEFRNQSPQG